MSRPRRTQRAFSAGGVVTREGPGGEPEVVVCLRNRGRLVCLPKGTPEADEEPLQTALREVREETGLSVEAVAPLGDIQYWFAERGARVHKTVRWWLMRATGGSVDDHDEEFEVVKWVPIGEAANTLSFVDERNILAKAEQELGVEMH